MYLSAFFTYIDVSVGNIVTLFTCCKLYTPLQVSVSALKYESGIELKLQKKAEIGFLHDFVYNK